jgi:hypothetical protein
LIPPACLSFCVLVKYNYVHFEQHDKLFPGLIRYHVNLLKLKLKIN